MTGGDAAHQAVEGPLLKEGVPVNQRIQKRIQVSISVRVSGRDRLGTEFDESTEALDVSRRGLAFLTHRELGVLDKVNVILPGRGPSRSGEGPSDFYSEATVVRISPEGEAYRVALRFVGATLPVYMAETA
jgi:hypothetical protein